MGPIISTGANSEPSSHESRLDNGVAGPLTNFVGGVVTAHSRAPHALTGSMAHHVSPTINSEVDGSARDR